MRTLKNARNTVLGTLVMLLAGVAPGAGNSISQLPTNQTRIDRPAQAIIDRATQKVDLAYASDLLDCKVANASGDTLGTVKDLVLNSRRNAIDYVVVSHGGIAGIGESLVAVPYSRIHLAPMSSAMKSGNDFMPGMLGHSQTAAAPEPQRSELRLDMSLDEFAKLNKIEGNRWPDSAAALDVPQTATSSDQKSNQAEPTAAERAVFNTRKVSELIGASVRLEPATSAPSLSTKAPISPTGDATQSPAQAMGKEVGQIKDVAMNGATGSLIYGVVTTEHLAGGEGQESVAPWTALRIESQPKLFAQLHVPNTSILKSFPYSKDERTKLDSQSYAKRIFQAYAQEPHWEVLGFVSPEGGEQNHQAPTRPMKPESGANGMHDTSGSK